MLLQFKVPSCTLPLPLSIFVSVSSSLPPALSPCLPFSLFPSLARALSPSPTRKYSSSRKCRAALSLSLSSSLPLCLSASLPVSLTHPEMLFQSIMMSCSLSLSPSAHLSLPLCRPSFSLPFSIPPSPPLVLSPSLPLCLPPPPPHSPGNAAPVDNHEVELGNDAEGFTNNRRPGVLLLATEAKIPHVHLPNCLFQVVVLSWRSLEFGGS